MLRRLVRLVVFRNVMVSGGADDVRKVYDDVLKRDDDSPRLDDGCSSELK